MKNLLLSLSALFLLSCTHNSNPESHETPLPPTTEIQREPSGFTENCRSGSARGQSYSWCLNEDSSSRSSTVVYYFHGNGGSERSWNTPERETMKNLWKKKNQQAPMVVTISFGASWFLSERGGFFSGSMHEALVNHVIPEVESSLRGRVKKRILMGESMGGYNASLLATKNPALFQRVAIICPAIYPFTPFVSEGEIQSFMARNRPHLNEKLLRKWISKLASAFPDSSAYAQHDPLQLVRRLNSKAPTMYILANGADEFGFYEGGERFYKLAKAQGVNTIWHGIPKSTHCGHSGASFEALAQFLAE